MYVELEAAALSREIPFSLRWVVDPIVRRVESVTHDIVEADCRAGQQTLRSGCAGNPSDAHLGAATLKLWLTLLSCERQNSAGCKFNLAIRNPVRSQASHRVKHGTEHRHAKAIEMMAEIIECQDLVVRLDAYIVKAGSFK